MSGIRSWFQITFSSIFAFPFSLEFFDNTVISHIAVSMERRFFPFIVSHCEQQIELDFFALCHFVERGVFMDDYRLRVAKALEMARAESGLSQQKLADRMGVGRTSIYRYEQGTMTPDASTIIKWFVCCGVAVKRYIDACLHPGLLESLAEDTGTGNKRYALIKHIEETNAEEIDLLFYLIYGNHGSDYLAVLCEVVANLHTTLRDRVSICRAITGHYEMAKATRTDPDPDGTQPNMQILYQAQDCGEAAAMKQNDAYTINEENILR